VPDGLTVDDERDDYVAAAAYQIGQLNARLVRLARSRFGRSLLKATHPAEWWRQRRLLGKIIALAREHPYYARMSARELRAESMVAMSECGIPRPDWFAHPRNQTRMWRRFHDSMVEVRSGRRDGALVELTSLPAQPPPLRAPGRSSARPRAVRQRRRVARTLGSRGDPSEPDSDSSSGRPAR
jgi:hypothetical protein